MICIKNSFFAVINSGKELSVDALDIAKQIIATDKNADYNITAPNIDACEICQISDCC